MKRIDYTIFELRSAYEIDEVGGFQQG